MRIFRSPNPPDLFQDMSVDMTRSETIRVQFAGKMMEAAEVVAPVFDTANAFRTRMIVEGWSDSAAEAAAGIWLQTMLLRVTGVAQ